MALCYCLEERHFSRCGEHVNDKALSEGGRERAWEGEGTGERGRGGRGDWGRGDGRERGRGERVRGERTGGRGDGREREGGREMAGRDTQSVFVHSQYYRSVVLTMYVHVVSVVKLKQVC